MRNRSHPTIQVPMQQLEISSRNLVDQTAPEKNATELKRKLEEIRNRSHPTIQVPMQQPEISSRNPVDQTAPESWATCSASTLRNQGQAGQQNSLQVTHDPTFTREPKKKKTRGITTCKDIYARTRGQREEVTFDTVGPTNQSVSNLTNFVGTLGRNKRFVSLSYTNWHAVPQNAKDFIWRYVNTKFILPASCEKWVIQTARDSWKRFNGKIKRKHFVPYDDVEDMMKNRPRQSMSERNKQHKKQQKFPHRMGPINFGRVRAALRAEKGTNEEPKRFEMFIVTRTSQKRKEIEEATQSAIEDFHSRQASGETDEEAFESLFGKEQPGRATPRGSPILGDVRDEVHGLRNMVKLLFQQSDPGMRPEEVEAMLQNAHHSPIDANSGHGSNHAQNMNMDNLQESNEE
ncbi:hypothetical protein PIB30_051071 [Stylosanthes scabra]|uniref:Transposase, Ptta/En/Spm, plant n=1 Tax=Stylosanthes scabra TaxID=79078 RepID=A0ABU6WJF7_9FABA|nr:hypothetical protein [Stylosanthes scabra]